MSVSDRLLMQRYRNRVIETLDMLSDATDTVSSIGTGEALNIWDDFVCEEKLAFYSSPVFSEDELAQLGALARLISQCRDNVPSTWQPEQVTFSGAWSEIVKGASQCLLVFNKRGRLDEDR